MRTIQYQVLALLFTATGFGLGCSQTVISDGGGETDLQLLPLDVYTVTPATEIKHGIEWRSVLDEERQKASLVGPKWHLAQRESKPDAAEVICLNAYELPTARDDIPSKAITIQLDREDGIIMNVGLAPATHFLLTAQSLQEGSPAEPPEKLSRFIAHPIVDPISLSGDFYVTALETNVPLGKAVYVLLPAEEWHHSDYYPVTDARACWIVYENSEFTAGGTISTLDEMGLNSLDLSEKKYFCVPARWSQP